MHYCYSFLVGFIDKYRYSFSVWQKIIGPREANDRDTFEQESDAAAKYGQIDACSTLPQNHAYQTVLHSTLREKTVVRTWQRLAYKTSGDTHYLEQ